MELNGTLIGIENTLKYYGGMFYGLSKSLSPAVKLDEDAAFAESVARELNARVPLDRIQEERAWRNTCLSALAKLKRDLETKTTSES